jgi:hypothetical protein
VGLKVNPSLLGELRENVDEALIVDLNIGIPDLGSPDLILCLEVLEHPVAPAEVLAGLTARLNRGGTVMVSLPNVAHLSVSLPLLLSGRFDYRDAGILDRTHLRFFVRDSAIALPNQAGLVARQGIRSGLTGSKARLADMVTLGLLRDRLTKQYILAGTPADEGATQAGIRWLVA